MLPPNNRKHALFPIAVFIAATVIAAFATLALAIIAAITRIVLSAVAS